MSAPVEFSPETKVSDLPLWPDCPWRPLIASRFSIHRGTVLGQDLGIVYDLENDLHISALADSFTTENLEPAMLNLCGCAWEKKFGAGAGRPELYMELLSKKNGLPSPLSDEEYTVLEAQYEKSHLWQAPGLPGSQSVN